MFDADRFMQSPERKSLVLLIVQGQDTTGKPATNTGTAFFISPRGFALTAAHLFYSHSDPTDASQRLHAAGGQSLVAGRIGSAGTSAQLFNLVRINPDQDVALVQLLDPPEPTQFLKVCSSTTPSLTEDLAAFGFTAAQSLTAVTGRRIGPLNEARYPTGININPGMSGGPIVTTAGKVFGMAISGVREQQFQGYNFFLPLQFAGELIQSSQVSEDCSPMSSGNSQTSVASRTVARPPLTIGERTVLLDGFTQYAQSSFNFRDRHVVAWGDLTGDIGVSNTQSHEPRDPQASLFLPYDAPPYPDARKARGEIARAPHSKLARC